MKDFVKEDYITLEDGRVFAGPPWLIEAVLKTLENGKDWREEDGEEDRHDV